jgi:PAS domain S-box-containing protein
MDIAIHRAKQDTVLLGFLEAQYGIVQKATFLALAYAQSIDFPERNSLRENIHAELKDLLVFGTTSNDIIVEKTGLPPPIVRTLRSLYFTSPAPLNQKIEEYFSGIKKFLLGSPIRVRPDNPQLLAFQAKNARLLVSLRATIKEAQNESLAGIQLVRLISILLFVINLLFLGIIGVLVFLPTLKKLGIYLHEMGHINEALEAKVSERTSELDHKTRQLGLTNEELREQIDERIRIEKELRQSNAFLDSIVENIPAMLFIKDAKELRFVRFNRSGEELLGYSRGELLGKNDYSFFPKPEADIFVEKDREALRKGGLLEIEEETIHTRKKGPRILHTKKIPIVDSQGTPLYLLGISEDITDKIQTELQVREFSMAMEHALDGIARLDPDRNFLSVNRSFAAMMGYESDEIVGLNRLSTVCDEDRDKLIAAFEKMKSEGKAEVEIKALRKDGSIFHQYAVMIRLCDKDESFSGFYCFAKDVTERKYHESLEIKADLIQMVSHELRTPIHSVKEGLSIVLEGLTGEITPEQKEVLSISKRCIDRLARLVTDVLSFHKLEAGVIEFHMKKENLNKIIAEVVSSMRPLAENKNLSLKVDLQKDIPEIAMDRDKIIQVLTNFIQNAVKFTLQGGITITSSSGPQGATVAIKDTGIGIQQSDFSKLFRKFGQLESAKLIAPGGTGLGLAISKKIVENHHGKVEVESEFKKGSSFIFTLPIDLPIQPLGI